MDNIDELLGQISQGAEESDLRLIKMAYKHIVNDENEDDLNELVEAFIRIATRAKKEKKEAVGGRGFSSKAIAGYYEFLLKVDQKRETTAYDYCKRVERLCKKHGSSPEALLSEAGLLSLEKLIRFYTEDKKGIEENKAVHNAYSASLVKFRKYAEEGSQVRPLEGQGREKEDE